MNSEHQRRILVKFDEGNKPLSQGEAKSTSLSSSSSGSSLHRQTDTKYPADILRHKRHSTREKHRPKVVAKQFLAVEEQGEQQDKNDYQQGGQRRLPRVPIMNDRMEFNASQKGLRMSRCKSVGTLSKVLEEKKEQDESKKLICKLNNLLDKDEFNQRKSSTSMMHSENLEPYLHTSSLISEIFQTEQPREDHLSMDKTMQLSERCRLSSELDKIIVDEIDDRKKHREERHQEPVIESILEERNDDEGMGEHFRTAMEKLHEQKDFIKRMNNSEEVKVDLLPADNKNITLLTESIREENEADGDA